MAIAFVTSWSRSKAIKITNSFMQNREEATMGHPVRESESWTGVDPVCGMEVSEQSEFHFHHEGVDYHFCSKHCEKKFAADPSAYLNGKGIDQTTGHEHSPAESGHGYYHDGVVMKVTDSSVADTAYTCLMHPEIRANHPGACPTCGMALESLSVNSAQVGNIAHFMG
jgi:Cu+-exporting ATPase